MPGKKSLQNQKKEVLFPEIGRVKFFYHLPALISQMCMRIDIFCFKKNRHKNSFHQQIYSCEFTFFSLQKIKDRGLFVFQQRRVLLQQFFKCKRDLKISIKLIKNIIFAATWVKIFFVTRISTNKSIISLAQCL